MAATITKKAILSATAAAVVFGLTAPAFAGGRYHHRGHNYHGHYHGHYYGHGGRGAAIALGVIGGAIILNEISQDRARDRYYEDRYYDEAYRRRAYQDGYADGRSDERRDGDARSYDDDFGDDDGGPYDEGAYDDGLAGGPEDAAGEPYDRGGLQPISARAAYQTCLDHARRALGERGFTVSAPYRPDTIEDRGGALLMTATVTAQRGPDHWSRAMSCEANEAKVYRLELI